MLFRFSCWVALQERTLKEKNMKNFIFTIGFLFIVPMCIFAGRYISDEKASKNAPSPQTYVVTVNISRPDCIALQECSFEVVLYRGNSMNDWQAIDRKPYVYGTNSYVFTVSVDPVNYTYIGTKILYQPDTSCNYPHDISDYDYYDITTMPSGGSFSLSLEPCY